MHRVVQIAAIVLTAALVWSVVDMRLADRDARVRGMLLDQSEGRLDPVLNEHFRAAEESAHQRAIWGGVADLPFRSWAKSGPEHNALAGIELQAVDVRLLGRKHELLDGQATELLVFEVSALRERPFIFDGPRGTTYMIENPIFELEVPASAEDRERLRGEAPWLRWRFVRHAGAFVVPPNDEPPSLAELMRFTEG